MLSILMLARDANLPVRQAGLFRVRRGGAVASVIAAAVPAHGFIVNGKGLISSAATGVHRSPVWGWLRTFLGACVWAAMMAGGMLVYQHFVKKWEAKGFPILPTAALTAIGQGQARPGTPIQVGPSSASPRSSNEKPRQTSFLDEYDG